MARFCRARWVCRFNLIWGVFVAAASLVACVMEVPRAAAQQSSVPKADSPKAKSQRPVPVVDSKATKEAPDRKQPSGENLRPEPHDPNTPTVAAGPGADRIAELIEQLGDPQYVVRERAQSELKRIGPPALDALTKALEHDDIEIAMRSRHLLGTIKVDWAGEDDSPRTRVLLKKYDELDDDGRLEVAQELARTGGPSEIAILCRIIRYERSHLVSKGAALLLIGLPDPIGSETWQSRSESITKGLSTTNRTGAEWVRSYLAHRADPQKSLDQWKKLVEAEQQAFKTAPRSTSREIVSELLRREVDMLDRLGRRDEALAVMRQMVPLERGQDKSIARLVDWFAQKQAWSVIVEMGGRFGHTFEQYPLLLYFLAEAHAAEGQQAKADEVAKKALALGGDEPVQHHHLADELQKRGLFRWSELERRRVIEIGPAANDRVIQSYIRLAEMHHDQHREELAAKALEPLVKQFDEQPAILEVLREMKREPGETRSRMYYFLSEHEREQGNIARQTELLDQAIANDATDADVLIAMYRLPNQTDARREQTLRRIKAAADAFRREIQQDPDSPNGYNQLAWLLGNTLAETDPKLADEAIAMSKKSLEVLPPDLPKSLSAGFLDTLGRCYFAKGDLESAIKYQTEAARLEPHSGLIRRQLKLFQDALTKKQDAQKAKS